MARLESLAVDGAAGCRSSQHVPSAPLLPEAFNVVQGARDVGQAAHLQGPVRNSGAAAAQPTAIGTAPVQARVPPADAPAHVACGPNTGTLWRRPQVEHQSTATLAPPLTHSSTADTDQTASPSAGVPLLDKHVGEPTSHAGFGNAAQVCGIDDRAEDVDDGRSEASSCTSSLDSRSPLTPGVSEGYQSVIRNPLARKLSAGLACHDLHNRSASNACKLPTTHPVCIDGHACKQPAKLNANARAVPGLQPSAHRRFLRRWQDEWRRCTSTSADRSSTRLAAAKDGCIKQRRVSH